MQFLLIIIDYNSEDKYPKSVVKSRIFHWIIFFNKGISSFSGSASKSQRPFNWYAGQKEIIQLTQSPEEVSTGYR